MIKALFSRIDQPRKELRVYSATIGFITSGLIIVVVTLFVINGSSGNSAYSHHEKGSLFMNQGLYWDAIEEFTKAIELNPNLTQTYLYRGHAYSQVNEYQNAIGDYNKGINLDSTIAQAYDNRGAAHHNLGQIQLAIDDYNKAIELDPTLSKVYSNRSIAYAQLGKYAKSEADKVEACTQDKDLC